ncbi:MAG: hypothetical protein IT167_22465 [Bryobacterales bacterium]|nr:hypothetical protein [Bryobacterales bacterium]
MKTPKTQAPNLPDLDSAFRAGANTGNWRLPSGIPLGEYALQAGFLVPSLWNLSVRCAFARNHQPASPASSRWPISADASRRVPRAFAQPAVREC